MTVPAVVEGWMVANKRVPRQIISGEPSGISGYHRRLDELSPEDRSEELTWVHYSNSPLWRRLMWRLTLHTTPL
jgi:hypothetical protein